MTTHGGDGPKSPTRIQTPTSPVHGAGGTSTRTRSSTANSSRQGRTRSASLRFLESTPPSGMWHATGTALAQAPSPMEIRRGSFGHRGWDGESQRRNSTVSQESVRRLSRQSSANTPGSLGRSATNPMDSHVESPNEGDSSFPTVAERGEMSNQAFVPRPKGTVAKAAGAEAVDDDDDPFSKFIGRGKMDDQAYVPRSKVAPKQIDEPVDDEYRDVQDFLDENDPRPVKRTTLPKKFLDPSGDAVPRPDSTLLDIPTNLPRPSSSTSGSKAQPGPNEEGVYPNGYKFPPEHTWGEATKIGLKAFWKFTLTPLGFLIVLYGLNVVAWGGMLFLLLIGGGQQFMCYPPGSHGQKDCNNINAPRRIWIEIDSQILNALFCVTGFGLIPWRFRDLYYLLQFRIRHKQSALRRLAGIHRSWFRLPGSADLPADPDTPILDAESNLAVPLPTNKQPDYPLTGIRAPPTSLWRMDYVIWAYILNTFLQAVLSGFMWGLNRYDRPSWSTGLFVALACIVAALGGLMCFQEGKKIKKVEGIPVKEEEVLTDVEQRVVEGEKGKRNGKGRKKTG